MALSLFVANHCKSGIAQTRSARQIGNDEGFWQRLLIEMGLKLASGERDWRESEGTPNPKLQVKLEDGETVRMTWLRDELRREFYDGNAVIMGCFAVDGATEKVSRRTASN